MAASSSNSPVKGSKSIPNKTFSVALKSQIFLRITVQHTCTPRFLMETRSSLACTHVYLSSDLVAIISPKKSQKGPEGWPAKSTDPGRRVQQYYQILSDSIQFKICPAPNSKIRDPKIQNPKIRNPRFKIETPKSEIQNTNISWCTPPQQQHQHQPPQQQRPRQRQSKPTGFWRKHGRPPGHWFSLKRTEQSYHTMDSKPTGLWPESLHPTQTQQSCARARDIFVKQKKYEYDRTWPGRRATPTNLIFIFVSGVSAATFKVSHRATLPFDILCQVADKMRSK